MICGKMLQRHSAVLHMLLEKNLRFSYHQYAKFLWSTICGYAIIILCIHHFRCLPNYARHFLQYRKWEEIENRLLRREPLITENLSVQKYTQCPPDVISDPLDDFDGTPSEIADETQRQPRSHQVICLPFTHNIFPLLSPASYDGFLNFDAWKSLDHYTGFFVSLWWLRDVLHN